MSDNGPIAVIENEPKVSSDTDVHITDNPVVRVVEEGGDLSDTRSVFFLPYGLAVYHSTQSKPNLVIVTPKITGEFSSN